MGVTLYTSRVVLAILGETDYGLYYAIFSVIGLLSFLNGTLSAGTSRFLTFELGKGNESRLKTTFSTTFYSHLLLAGIILLLGETVGVWYVNNIFVIPDGRYVAVMTVFQISVISTLISIIQVPFTAEIIAHERMNVYAYLGIYEAIARLAVVYLLKRASFDELIYYTCLQALVVISVFGFYLYYSYSRFKEVAISCGFDKSIFKDILKFSGWNIIANISETLMSQGIIMLYNLFFLPVVVAAQAVANQVAQAVSQLVNNVRQAVNPQVIKLYADAQYQESKRLTMVSAEYIFYILLLLGVPCILIMPRLMSLWLVDVPDYAVAFSRLMIVQMILGNFSAAFYTPMLAANKIAKNSLASVVLCIFQFGVLWLLFHFGLGPLWARYLGIMSAVVFSFLVKPYILWKDIEYSLKEIYKCIGKCLILTVCVILINFLLYRSITQNSIISVVIVTLLSLSSIFILEYWFIGNSERTKIVSLICQKLRIHR